MEFPPYRHFSVQKIESELFFIVKFCFYGRLSDDLRTKLIDIAAEKSKVIPEKCISGTGKASNNVVSTITYQIYDLSQV